MSVDIYILRVPSRDCPPVDGLERVSDLDKYDVPIDLLEHEKLMPLELQLNISGIQNMDTDTDGLWSQLLGDCNVQDRSVPLVGDRLDVLKKLSQFHSKMGSYYRNVFLEVFLHNVQKLLEQVQDTDEVVVIHIA